LYVEQTTPEVIMNGTATRPATRPQRDLIRTLLIELGEISPLGVEMANLARVKMNDARFVSGDWDYDVASGWITCLKALKVDARADVAPVIEKVAESAKPKVEIPEVPAGSYALEIDGVWKFYLVEVSKTGYVSVQVQHSDETSRLAFNPMIAVLKGIVEVTPLEACKAYGRQIGECGKCHRTLTNPESIAAGIGPVCAGRLS